MPCSARVRTTQPDSFWRERKRDSPQDVPGHSSSAQSSDLTGNIHPQSTFNSFKCFWMLLPQPIKYINIILSLQTRCVISAQRTIFCIYLHQTINVAFMIEFWDKPISPTKQTSKHLFIPCKNYMTWSNNWDYWRDYIFVIVFLIWDWSNWNESCF